MRTARWRLSNQSPYMITRGIRSANGSETMVIQDQRTEGKGGVRHGADALRVLCTRARILGAAGIRGRPDSLCAAWRKLPHPPLQSSRRKGQQTKSKARAGAPGVRRCKACPSVHEGAHKGDRLTGALRANPSCASAGETSPPLTAIQQDGRRGLRPAPLQGVTDPERDAGECPVSRKQPDARRMVGAPCHKGKE